MFNFNINKNQSSSPEILKQLSYLDPVWILKPTLCFGIEIQTVLSAPSDLQASVSIYKLEPHPDTKVC